MHRLPDVRQQKVHLAHLGLGRLPRKQDLCPFDQIIRAALGLAQRRTIGLNPLLTHEAVGIEAAFERALSGGCRAIYLVNNAGVTRPGIPQADSDWQVTIDVNLEAPFRWARHFANRVAEGSTTAPLADPLASFTKAVKELQAAG